MQESTKTYLRRTSGLQICHLLWENWVWGKILKLKRKTTANYHSFVSLKTVEEAKKMSVVMIWWSGSSLKAWSLLDWTWRVLHKWTAEIKRSVPVGTGRLVVGGGVDVIPVPKVRSSRCLSVHWWFICESSVCRCKHADECLNVFTYIYLSM